MAFWTDVGGQDGAREHFTFKIVISFQKKLSAHDAFFKKKMGELLPP